MTELLDLEVDLWRRRSLGECQGLCHSLLRSPGTVSVQMAVGRQLCQGPATQAFNALNASLTEL